MYNHLSRSAGAQQQQPASTGAYKLPVLQGGKAPAAAAAYERAAPSASYELASGNTNAANTNVGRGRIGETRFDGAGETTPDADDGDDIDL